MVGMISLDSETTGLDLYHGAQPFFVTICNTKGQNTAWEFDVDPKLRRPVYPREDLEEIQGVIDDAKHLVLQNPKFDVAALNAMFEGTLRWDWAKVYDTLLAGHLLASNQPHDLTTMVLVYCNKNIEPLENALKEAVNTARRHAAKEYPHWLLAKKGLAEMPSVKESAWHFDMWLPRAIAQRENYPPEHPWWNVLANYSNGDSTTTLNLFMVQRKLLKERGLWNIYLERLKVLPVALKMEQKGITISEERLDKTRKVFCREAQENGQRCVAIAKRHYKYDLELPSGGINNSLRGLLSKIQAEIGADVSNTSMDNGDGGSKAVLAPAKTKSGADSWNKNVLTAMLDAARAGSPAHEFITNLLSKRKRNTAASYMESYKRFWLPHGRPAWHVLHPSLNPTGTDTLRWSSSNPNEQNISKQEGFNLRYCFGPAPGREWWSLDAKNIELRLPAYEAGEQEMIDLFEHPDDPPYFGSNHLLVFDLLHTKRLKLDTSDPEYLLKAKKRYASAEYQWVKNGNFAVQYGAMEQSGTADRAFHQVGAQRKVQSRFSKIAKLNEQMIAMANEKGYVETIPDKTVDAKRGYPLLCTRSKWGKILPTVPLNYHIQGTACWWMMKAMVRCQAYLDTLNATRKWGEESYHLVMQIHDEMVFDFPKLPKLGNLPKIRKIKRLMEESGKDLGIPTPVSCEYHEHNWSEGVSV
jgi:DNA polymerase I-like protein with 3'-5' exonuclease and polymerase domains